MTARTTVVMLPGLLCDDEVWQAQRAALADAHCVVPDYGTLASITTMATRVLAELPGQQLCVAGHSMGGRVALEMARLAPERIAKLALLDTGLTPRPEDATGLAEQRQRLELLAVARAQGMGAMAQRWVRGMVHPDQIDTPVFKAIVAMVERKTPDIYQAQIQALLERPDARPVLSRLRCPTLLLCGRQDNWSPLSRHEQMHAMVPGSELVVVEDSGHMTTMEQPAAVNAALRRWIDA